MPFTSLHLANRTPGNCILITTVLHANEYFCSSGSVRRCIFAESGFSRGFPFEDKFIVGTENSLNGSAIRADEKSYTFCHIFSGIIIHQPRVVALRST